MDTPYNADELMQVYNLKGNPEAYRTVLAHFETKPCGRCGGGGHYSYCQRYGTLCFGCHGTGFKFTARGQAAYDWYNGLLSKPQGELQVGDKMRDERDGAWRTVQAVEPYTGAPSRHRVGDGPWVEGKRGVTIKTGPVGGATMMTLVNTDPDKLVRVAATAEQKANALAAAVAYQAGLTKAGTPRKRVAKAVA